MFVATYHFSLRLARYDVKSLYALGLFATTFGCKPTAPDHPAASCIQQVSSSGDRICVLSTSGETTCVGRRLNERLPPSRVAGSYTTVSQDCGIAKDTGSIVCWPNSLENAGPAPEFGRDNVELALGVGFQRCVRKRDASVFCVRQPTFGVQGSSATFVQGAVQIAGGPYATCARRATDVQCWGDNEFGELGREPLRQAIVPEWQPAQAVTGLPNDIISITHAWDTFCALSVAGEVWCWGSNANGGLGTGRADGHADKQAFAHATPQRVALPQPIEQIAGGQATCALTRSHEVWCWGDNTLGQVRNPVVIKHTPNAEGEQIEVAAEHTPIQWQSLGKDNRTLFGGGANMCVLKFDGSLWCWGSNQSIQLNTDHGKGAFEAKPPEPPRKMREFCQGL